MARYRAYNVKRVGAFRSGLEDRISKQLESKKVKVSYEQWRVPYVVPAREATYTPDFLLPNGIFIETKGLWEAEDRKKHLLIKEQRPDLDIRIVFNNSRAKLYKGSPTSYAEFCEKNNIKFADKLIPAEWLKEPQKVVEFEKLKTIRKKTKEG